MLEHQATNATVESHAKNLNNTAQRDTVLVPGYPSQV
jgi:hypothetical protein